MEKLEELKSFKLFVDERQVTNPKQRKVFLLCFASIIVQEIVTEELTCSGLQVRC